MATGFYYTVLSRSIPKKNKYARNIVIDRKSKDVNTAIDFRLTITVKYQDGMKKRAFASWFFGM